MINRDQQKDPFERVILIFNLVAGIFVLVSNFFIGDVMFGLALVLVVIVAGILLHLFRKEMSKRQVITSVLATAGVLVLTILIRITFTPPIFEISPINVDKKAPSLFGWQMLGKKDVFEINHHLIDSRNITPFGDIPSTDVPTDVKNVTIHLEIDPRYYGTRSFSNILLRISGKSGKFKDIPLWDSFNSDSTGVNKDISLKDMVEISGIEEVAKKIVPNLPENEKDIPEAELSLTIILEKDPRKALSATRKILIRSEPWVQYTKVVIRDSQEFIDYSLKNFGTKGEFGYHARITKITGPISDFSSPLWSGTGEITQRIPDSPIFTLDQGQSFKTTIPLPSDLPRGRYVVQIYTFKVPKNAEFNKEIDWATYGGSWMFATYGDTYVIVDCDDDGKNCLDSITLPVEQMKPEAFDYDGRAENIGGYAAMHVFTNPLKAVSHEYADDRIVNTYILHYHIDPQKPGYAGFALEFADHPDVSSFRAVRMKISMPNEKCTMIFRAQSYSSDQGVQNDIILGNGEYGASTSDEQQVEVPLSAFEGVDFTQLSGLYFVAGEDNVPSENNLTFTVLQIEFIH